MRIRSRIISCCGREIAACSNRARRFRGGVIHADCGGNLDASSPRDEWDSIFHVGELSIKLFRTLN